MSTGCRLDGTSGEEGIERDQATYEANEECNRRYHKYTKRKEYIPANNHSPRAFLNNLFYSSSPLRTSSGTVHPSEIAAEGAEKVGKAAGGREDEWSKTGK